MKDKSIHSCIALVKMLKKVYSKKKHYWRQKKQYNKVANDLDYFQMCKNVIFERTHFSKTNQLPNELVNNSALQYIANTFHRSSHMSINMQV